MQFDFPRFSLNKLLLFLSFLIGSGGIIWLKAHAQYHVFNDADHFLLFVFGWPIAVMITYWLIAWIVNERLIYEVIGDNCYYLGFVFTLVSLAMTLFLLEQVGGESGQNQIPIEELISGFGIALSSTIVGVILRVLMLRITPDLVQKENEAHLDLDEAMRDFRLHLRMGVQELKRCSVESTQMLKEQRHEMRDALAAEMEERTSGVAKVAKFIEETDRALADHRSAFQKAMEHDLGVVHATAKESISDFREALADAVGSLSVSGTQFRESLRSNNDATRAIVESGVGDINRILKQSAETFAAFRDDVDRLVGSSRATFEQTIDSINACRKELEGVEALGNFSEIMVKNSHDLEAALNDLTSKVASVTDSIATKLEPATNQLGESTSFALESLTVSSGKLQLAAERFESAASRTEAADMQTNIATAAERVADAVNELKTATHAISGVTETVGALLDRVAKPKKRGMFSRGLFGRSGS